MKFITTLSAVALAAIGFAAPAQATLQKHINDFCSGVRQMNAAGVSAAPGTYMAKYLQEQTGESASTYRMVWTIAKSKSCKTIR